jgi:uncharacterized protein YndB with AHSA1/START domain
MGYIREIEIAVPPSRAFRAWASEAEVIHWLAPRARVALAPGGPYELFWAESPETDSTQGCRVIAVEPDARIELEWRGRSDFDPLFAAPHGPTRVEVRFAPGGQAGSSRVVVEQRETRALPGWSAYDEWMADAWEEALVNLRGYLEGATIAPAWRRP